MFAALNKGKISREDFLAYLQEKGASESEALLTWLYLEDQEYIVNNQFSSKCEHGIILLEEIKQFEPVINELFVMSADIWRNVYESATHSAAVGGIISGFTTYANFLTVKESQFVLDNTQVQKYGNGRVENMRLLLQSTEDERVSSGCKEEMKEASIRAQIEELIGEENMELLKEKIELKKKMVIE
mmetsp:Transcript_10631/g.7945  ORF Transcript_10631/g.7945 Transcript_10631/m.7945 type:complete len:186 (+) Transcript_10631:522-1079(+)|eukprot:CAMPEP_0202974154 /NCGR_PEP_ID=MMETSP1396-20130829/57778_1 /ASSEMBLY_ACC=CAM_ASM_000872 /TAXON_ID= /ORGANISM="Pseudokeronopsis sp., Strain Brazil" /LENGTH=185 /DNA_ID=CAMNT_0049707481 /DNA_START=508 /DNA_END=1065 /DNA_ORIENTATION=+